MENRKTTANAAGTKDERADEIIRIQKKRNNFVMLDKGFIEDERLSMKAKGILCYLLSKPDQWKVIVKDIVKHCKDGKHSIYAGLNELKKYGYYNKYPIRDGQRIIRWESVVYECPQDCKEDIKKRQKEQQKSQKKSAKPPIITTNSLLPNFQDIENLVIENQDIENQEHSNINISNQRENQNLVSIYPQTPTSNENKIDTDTIDRYNNNDPILFNHTTDSVANNINLDSLKADYANRGDEISLLYDIICEVLINPNTPTVRISKQNIPIATAKQVFAMLQYEHLKYVLDSLVHNDNIHKIQNNTKSYFTTSLFHSVRTITYYYKRDFKKNEPKSAWDIQFEKTCKLLGWK